MPNGSEVVESTIDSDMVGRLVNEFHLYTVWSSPNFMRTGR